MFAKLKAFFAKPSVSHVVAVVVGVALAQGGKVAVIAQFFQLVFGVPDAQPTPLPLP